MAFCFFQWQDLFHSCSAHGVLLSELFAGLKAAFLFRKLCSHDLTFTARMLYKKHLVAVKAVFEAFVLKPGSTQTAGISCRVSLVLSQDFRLQGK